MIKKVLIVLASLIVLLLLIGFVLPGKVDTTKSISINAPAEYVFEEINNLENNEKWSYWANLYKGDMKVAYGDIRSGVGAYYEWDGEESGKGSLTITESVPNQSVKQDLDFMEEGSANAWYTLEPEGEGTKLTTGFTADLGMNPFMRWIGTLVINPEMEKAFDYNLTKLKEIAEAKPRFTVSISQVNTTPITYVGIQTAMSMKDMNAVSAQMGKSYGELMTALQKNKVQLAGAPFAIYPKWDEEKQEMEMICALPVAADANVPAKYKIMQTQGGNAVKAIHMGAYDKLGNTHTQIDEYIAYKKLELSGAPWEVYVTDPGTEADTAKWVTEVYYPVKGN